jgi:hypothetical protein
MIPVRVVQNASTFCNLGEVEIASIVDLETDGSIVGKSDIP